MASVADTTNREPARHEAGAGRAPSRELEPWEFIGLVAALTAFTTGPVWVVAVRVFSAAGDWEAGWIKYTFIAAAVLGAAVWISLATGGRLRRPDLALALAGTYTVLAGLSTLWSVIPYYTLWRSSTYVGLLALAWVLASLTYRTLLALFVTFCGIGAVASVVAIVLLPEVGRDGTGIWRGIYTNPNSLGPVCALLVIALVGWGLLTTSRRVRAISLAAAALALVPLVGSGSSTAAIGLALSVAAAVVVLAVAGLRRSGRPAAAVALAVASVVASVAAVVLAERLGVLDGLDKRTEVWGLVWERIWLKPTGGYGFFTYWDTNASLSPRPLARAGSAHNSALDATLGVGFAGFALVVGLAVTALVRAVGSAVRSPSAATAIWMALTTFVVLAHVTESFVSWFSYMWILLVLVAWGPPRDIADRPGPP